MIAIKILILLVGGGYVLMCAFVFLSQRGMVYNASRELEATPGQAGLEYEDVRFENGLGTSLHGWFLPHPESRFTLFFCHGNGGNVSHRMESYRIFHSLGLSAFIFDYSGYGQSKGKPGEKATAADARAAWQWLTEKKGIDPDQVIVFGRSLGGGVAAALARELHDAGVHPAGLILESTFFSLTDMGRRLYPWLPVKWLARYRYESGSALVPVRVPLLSIHSPQDNLVPYSQGRKLYDSYGGPKSFLEISGGHNRGFSESGHVYAHGLDVFIASLEKGRDEAVDES